MKEKKQSFPNNFFTKTRPQAKGNKEETIPFEWSKNVVNGKSKVEIISAKNN